MECTITCGSELRDCAQHNLFFSAEQSEDVVNNCVFLLSFRHFLSSCLANKKKENDKQLENIITTEAQGETLRLCLV